MDNKHLLSDTINSISESATLKMAQMARDYKAAGHDVISLSLGQPDFDTPIHIKEAAKEALDNGFTKYTPVAGLVQFREAISNKFKRENNLDYGLDQIVVSNGAKQSVANVCSILLNKDDEAILLAPYWVSYREIVKMTGGIPIMVSADIEQDYKVSPEQLEAAITDKTKLVIFSSPCNPTGSVYSKSELQAIATVINKYPNVMIVSDEIYEHINFVGEHISIGSFPEVRDQTITLNGMSKGFAMTGWRLGYMGAPKWIATACVKLQGQFTSGATSFGQMAAAHALNSSLQHTYEMRDAFKSRKKLVISLLSEIPQLKLNDPDGAFYVFPDISALYGKSDGEYTIADSDSFAEVMMKKCHVAIVAGSAFGAPNCFRISYAASEEQLKEAIRRIAAALKDFK